MTRLANFIMLAHGWRRCVLLVVAGALSGLSVPPLFVLPALFVGLPVVVWSLDGAERGRGWRRFFGAPFAVGFWFGLGYFAVALHWIGIAFFNEGNWIPLLAPVAVLLLAAVLALFWAVATASAHLLWSEGGFRIVVLAAALALMDYARGHLFSGFPFDLLGYALTANVEMMQAASLVGVYGLGLARGARRRDAGPDLAGARPAARPSAGAVLRRPGAAWPCSSAMASFGSTPPKSRRAPTCVSASSSPTSTNRRNGRRATATSFSGGWCRFPRRHRAAPSSGLAGITHLIWPESAFPFYLSQPARGAGPDRPAAAARARCF